MLFLCNIPFCFPVSSSQFDPIVQQELPKGKWFCSVNCTRIYSALQNLLNNGAEKLPGATLDVVMKKWEGKNLVADTDLDVRWRLLNGKNTSRETRVLLSQAVAIFHVSFVAS